MIKTIANLEDLSISELDAERLERFQNYFQIYYNDSFRLGQGTEDILSMIAKFGCGGTWIDLGAGPSTLFWSIPLSGVRQIDCNDVFPEALKILQDFVNSDELPRCYLEALEMFHKSHDHLIEMKGKVTKYYVFDALNIWPVDLAGSEYDLITQFGTFGTADSEESFVGCFEHLKPHLKKNGRVIGANWLRSPQLIEKEGGDNSYLTEKVVEKAAAKYDFKLLFSDAVEIRDDPSYEKVIFWTMRNE